MQFSNYQDESLVAAGVNLESIKLERDTDNPELMSKILGLSGETGEVLEKFKKIIRDKNGKFDNDDVKEIVKELGDVLWYVSAISKYLGVTLEEVAINNLDKLNSRKNRGELKGSGDNR